MKFRVAITGASGYLGQQLTGRMNTDPECELILALDIRPLELKLEKPSRFQMIDLTGGWEPLRDLFLEHQIDTGLHLAWQFNPIHDTARQRRVDVAGSGNFFRAAEAAGLKRVVYASSTTAYVNSRNPSQPPYLAEETPVTGTARYLYSRHKAEVDRMAQDFLRCHPEIHVIILRPSIVLGPHTRNIVSKMLEWPSSGLPWMFHVRGADPPMQFLSEEDAAEIFHRSLRAEARGVFNIAGDGVVRLSDVGRAHGRRMAGIPAPILYSAVEVAWKLRLAPFNAGILDLIRYPWVADNTRLKAVFAYTPRLTSRQALDSFVSGLAGGRLRPNQKS